jgi:hypothetical protein
MKAALEINLPVYASAILIAQGLVEADESVADVH